MKRKGAHGMFRTRAGIAKNAACIALIGFTFLDLILRWGSLPDRIPAHDNAAGAIDRWGGRAELWLLPVLMRAMTAGITVLERFPSLWNTGVAVNDENRGRVYAILGGMISTLKVVLCAVFAFLSWNSASGRALPVWFLPVSLALTFGSIGVYLFRLARSA